LTDFVFYGDIEKAFKHCAVLVQLVGVAQLRAAGLVQLKDPVM